MFIFSIFCIILLGIYCKASQLAGAYDIVIHRVCPCAGVPLTEGSLSFSKEFTPYNKTTILYSSNVTLPHGFHDGMRGTYNVRNWTPDMSVPTGIFPYNTYKADFSLFEMENRISCMVTEFEVISKV